MSGSLLGPETLINTDASDVGLWAIFTQQTGLRTEQVFTFASHTQIQANRDYSTTEQESSGLWRNRDTTWNAETFQWWQTFISGLGF